MSTPKELLKELYWSFREHYQDQQSFENDLTTYNTRLSKPAPKLDEIVFSEQKIVIQYLFLEDDFIEDEEDKQILIETDNPNGFTLSDLMYKINNTVVTEDDSFDLSDQDAHFFEGLEYLTDDDPDYPQTKVYYMILGS